MMIRSMRWDSSGKCSIGCPPAANLSLTGRARSPGIEALTLDELFKDHERRHREVDIGKRL